MPPSLLVSHPHAAAFATWTAQSLARHGSLASYLSGVVASRRSLAGRALAAMGQVRPRVLNRAIEDLGPGQVESFAAVEVAARLTARLSRSLGIRGPSTYDALFVAHDARVAFDRWPLSTTGVYAYEDGAERTFEKARARNLQCLWDLPLPHFETIRSILEAEVRQWPGAAAAPPIEPEWKQRRKEHERAMADAICVASPFTRESLERLGTKQPILVCPYPFPTSSFSPRTARPSGPLTFLSVGSHDLRKGTPYLLEAWKRGAPSGARLRLIGPMRLSERFVAPYRGTFEHLPHVPKAELGDHYRQADALVFPTLGDGFGLVIQEAMASGTPVITTRCGGGPVCITSGEDGWLIEERSIDALVEAFRFVAADRERAFQIGLRARTRAERWTDAIAGDALVSSLRQIL